MRSCVGFAWFIASTGHPGVRAEKKTPQKRGGADLSVRDPVGVGVAGCWVKGVVTLLAVVPGIKLKYRVRYAGGQYFAVRLR